MSKKPDDNLRALSVKQPWASLIAEGLKTVELRTRSTPYRGQVLICASLSPRRGTPYPIGPLGVSVCLVDLVDVAPATKRDADGACCNVSPGEFAWFLRNPKPVQFPVLGKLGLWRIDGELAALIEKFSKRSNAK